MFKKKNKEPVDWVKYTQSQLESQARALKQKSLNVFGIVFFITIIIVFVLNILKIVPFTIWILIWRFWPLFLLMFLIQLLSKKLLFLRPVNLAVGIGILASVIFFSISFVNPNANSLLNKISPKINYFKNYLGIGLGKKISDQKLIKATDYENPEKRNINTLVSLGSVNITDNKNDNYFLAESNYYENFGKPELTSKQDESTLNINFKTSQNLHTLLGSPEELNYSFLIGQPKLPTKLGIKTSAGFVTCTLNDIDLDEFSLEVMAGKANAKLNQKNLPEKININLGAGTLRLDLPQSTFAEIKYDFWLGQLIIDNQKLSRSGIYTTPKFSITEDPISINVNAGFGVVIINTISQSE